MAYCVGDTVYARDDVVEPATGKFKAKVYAKKGDALLVRIHREGTRRYIVSIQGQRFPFCVSEDEISAEPQ